ncbi:unannotated protein [freshwater metagenome]|uniref:Unannotated protein n=1 Tax=freshwater metagenome TaxID=449393 RepID=A0A6J7PDY5_9ZZZZ
MTPGGHALLIEHDEFLCDLANCAANLVLRFREIGSAHTVQHRRLAADVLPQRVDLVAGYVQLVAALVGQQQVVALDATDRALHHALVLADTVLAVHDVVAGLEVFEQPDALALAWPRLAVCAAATGEVGLGEDRHLGERDAAAAVQWGRDDVAARLREIRALADDRERQPTIEHQAGHALCRTLTVGSDDHPVAVGEQRAQAVGQALAIAHDRTPAHRSDERRVRCLGHAADRPHRLLGGQQTLGGCVQARELQIGVAGPRTGERASEIGLFIQQVLRTVEHAARFDQRHLRSRRKDVGEQLLAAGIHEPRQPRLHTVEQRAFGESLPLLAAPRLAGDQRRGALAHFLGGDQFACREHPRLVEVVGAALVVDRELGEAIDLIAPKVDTDRGLGSRGEDVDDRAALGDFASVFDEFLASVAVVHELRHQRIGVEDRTLRKVYGVDRGGSRSETLQQRAHAGDHDRRAAFRIA